MANERDYFYKYYSANSAILTLQSCSRKWSNPTEFNDPFDNQFDINFTGTVEEIEDTGKAVLIKHLLEGSPLPSCRFSGKDLNLIEYVRSIPKDELQKIIPQFKATKNIYPENFVEIQKERLLSTFKEVIAESSIFCLSETKDNLLMWSHYAENHTGVVIKFKDVPEKDTPIRLAQKVIYSDNIPSVPILKLFKNEISIKKVHGIYTLTKSSHWHYEKEWRIIAGLRDKNKTFEILPFAPEEITDIYLGCRIKQENKDKIIETVLQKYPAAGIYQAIKSKDRFELLFNKIIQPKIK